VRVGVGVDVGGFPVQRYSWIRSRLGIDMSTDCQLHKRHVRVSA
jgi:hypothetical protein